MPDPALTELMSELARLLSESLVHAEEAGRGDRPPQAPSHRGGACRITTRRWCDRVLLMLPEPAAPAIAA